MIVRCFEGHSMSEVMERVRQEMGEDAIILHTQQRRGLLWWLRRTPTIRVWAAVTRSSIANCSTGDESNVGGALAPNKSDVERTSTPNDCQLQLASPVANPQSPVTPSKQRKRGRKKSTHSAELSEASVEISAGKKSAKNSRRSQSTNHSELLDLAQRVERQLQLLATSLWGQEAIASQTGALGILWQCGVDLPTIQRLFSSSVPNPQPQAPTDEWLKSVLMRHLPVTGGLAPTTSLAVLVGPTGVGKTTTVAKIAANQLMHQRRRVALVTVDVFRIGAVQQLETYARLMGLPFFVATNPEEAKKCAYQAKQVADLVLVDTIGRSPKHTDQLASLWELVAAMDPDEVLLTLPANGNPADLALAADQFSIFCPTSLIITKLDEATQTGVIVNLVTRLNLPVSYVTTGQNVPEDLEVPTSERLAEWVLLPIRERFETNESAGCEVQGADLIDKCEVKSAGKLVPAEVRGNA
ncbi:MAG: flagellar biosynthesis protein FlhF [Armatimonadetes bacterium]|nr:flagellar biosynthesis protein FlhF [Armatimonadota bacterium]